jgi:hypothetical protein
LSISSEFMLDGQHRPYSEKAHFMGFFSD